MYKFSPSEVQAFKRQAKIYKKRLACSTSKALDHVAKQNGYDNWSLLQKHSFSQEYKKRPARVLRTERVGGYTVITIPVIRITIPNGPGGLIYRCPRCETVHGITDGGPHFGAGDGYRVVPCHPDSNLLFYFEETKEPTAVGVIDAPLMKRYVAELTDSDIKGWFHMNHPAVSDDSPWEGRAEGQEFSTIYGVGGIHSVLCDKFPSLDEVRLYSIAEELDAADVWFEASYAETRERDLLLLTPTKTTKAPLLIAASSLPRKSPSDMSKEELDIYSDMRNPNNDANIDIWADVHNPNNKGYLGTPKAPEEDVSDEELFYSIDMAGGIPSDF